MLQMLKADSSSEWWKEAVSGPLSAVEHTIQICNIQNLYSTSLNLRTYSTAVQYSLGAQYMLVKSHNNVTHYLDFRTAIFMCHASGSRKEQQLLAVCLKSEPNIAQCTARGLSSPR